MVKDKNNKIFNDLITYMRTIYPTLKGGEYQEKPQLPYLYFTQIDGSTRDVTLSNTEVSVNLCFQVEMYTDLGMNMARKMATDVRAYMIENGFRCINFMPMNSFSNVSRFVARYERLDV